MGTALRPMEFDGRQGQFHWRSPLLELSILNDDDRVLTRTTLRITTPAIFVDALLHSSVPSDVLQSPFSGLGGSRSGGGFIKLASGQRERLRCRTTNRNASGSVSGRVSGGEIQARIDGAGFSARLPLNTRGDRQSVVIESPGHDITEVSVALARTR